MLIRVFIYVTFVVICQLKTAKMHGHDEADIIDLKVLVHFINHFLLEGLPDDKLITVDPTLTCRTINSK